MARPATLGWVFDDAPASGARQVGLAMMHVIPAELDNFVREVLQNARDQRDQGESAEDGLNERTKNRGILL